LDASNQLIFSDIPANILYAYAPGKGHRIWRRPSDHSNGNTVDRQGSLISCQHGTRTVTKTIADGSRVIIASHYQGKRLNSPNDVVVTRDGSIWFTDPPYGITEQDIEQSAHRVYRVPPTGGEPIAVYEEASRPNGLCFNLDESLLYLADSDSAYHHIRRFRVTDKKELVGGEIFCEIHPGVPDGIRCDEYGNLWATAGDGVHVFAPDGRLLGKIVLPQVASNCTFGGVDRQTLYITAIGALWSISLTVRGAR
jgi:gluconolactonase